MISLHKYMKLKIIIFCASLIATLFFLEALLRMNLLRIPFINVSEWWNLEWLKNSKSYTSQHTAYIIDKYHPILGWSMKENVQLKTSLGNVISSNTHGFRGEKEYEATKPIDTLRIVSLGDSYAFGECVGDKETYVSYIEQRNPRLEVINMGVHGYGTDQILLKLQLEGILYHPDIVLLGFVNDDINRINLAFRDYFKPKFIFGGQTLRLTNVPLPAPDTYKIKLHTYLGLSLRAMLANAYESLFYKRVDYEKNILVSALFTQIVQATLGVGSKLYVVYLPSLTEVTANQINPNQSYNSLCQNASVVCINPTEALHLYLKAVQNPALLFQCHYSKEIHQIIASVVDDHLKLESPSVDPDL